MKESTRVLVALALGVVGGIAIAASHSAALLRAADFIAPIGTLWVNAIRMTVIPLIVSLLITGVASASDIRAVGRLGGRTLIVFLMLLAIVAIVVMPVLDATYALLPRHAATPAGSALSERQTFANFLTSLLPPNPIAAAANGDMLPLILFTLLFALAIARTGQRVLVDFFQAVVDAMLVLVRWIIFLAPIGVFALVLPLAAHAGSSVAGALGFFIAAYSIACVLVILLLYPVVRVASGIPMRRFARAAIEPQLIAFSSSSSIASLPALIDSAERELAIPTEVTGFVLPLAASMFKIAAPLSWTIGACFIGWFYGIPVGLGQLAIVAFAALFLAFAAPGVPRGGFIMLTPLFIAIGLPPEGIGILIAVDAIPDTFASALNSTGFLAATCVVGKR
ncbi:MAG TPA: dicarboxylate/amino acid:cation symporter [Thermoanaerobaculia bacterium]|nr:dicarboxylate/amino acid:cation symporter [Thermoanaerobaculia bacterium]